MREEGRRRRMRRRRRRRRRRSGVHTNSNNPSLKGGGHIFWARIMCSIYDIEPFLLRPAEPELRVLVKELFLARPCLLSLQVGAGIALQELILERRTGVPEFCAQESRNS